jgi:phosphonate transport system substrate-binding protein
LAEGIVDGSRVRSIWTSPGYCHCNFTIRDNADAQRFGQWTEILLSMDYNKPTDRKIMEMEGLKRWIRPQLEGYEHLFKAVNDLQFL